MSVLVPLPGGGSTREAAQKRRLRARTGAVLGTLALVAAMSAVPAPVWRASEDLDERAHQLRGWLDAARADERALAAFLARGGEAHSERVQSELERWLAPHDAVATRNELLRLAAAAGLSVADATLARNERPLQPAEARRDLTVLGAALPAPPSAPSAGGPLLDLVADRYVLTGTGPAPAVLLFCGIVHARPAPLRLRSVRLDEAGAQVRFAVTLDKFLDRSRAPNTEPTHADA